MAGTQHSKKLHGYTVSYDSANHCSVLFQLWGSAWPKVFPYCALNSLIMLFISWLNTFENIDLGITDKGHTFMTMPVAFLIVSRVTISLGRYNEARNHLNTMYKETREIVQNSVLYTQEQTDVAAINWRSTVAWRVILLLRSVMAVIDYPTNNVPAWEIPELNELEREDIKSHLYMSLGADHCAQRWAHEHRSEEEETMRVPVRLAFKLRTAIHSNRTELKTKLEPLQENNCLNNVNSFMGAYFGIRKFKTTPFPFPLVQMARTFLFFYVFTLPFAILNDSSSVFAHCVIVFIITYGFMGLETVSIELDDPFGDDPNDFDNLGMAYTAFEDTYLLILDIDGPDCVDKLRARMHNKNTDEPLSTEQSWLLSTSVHADAYAV